MHHKKFSIIIILLGLLFSSFNLSAEDLGKFPPVVSNDILKYKEYKNYHGGAGSVSFMNFYPTEAFGTNINFLRQGVIPPKSSIGEHYMKNGDEVYVILKGRALVTVNGLSGFISGVSYVACPMGSSAGIYNNTEKDVEFLCFGVSMEKGKYDTVDYGIDLTKSSAEFPPPFQWAHFDKENSYYLEKVHKGKSGMDICDAFGTGFAKTNSGGFGICVIHPGSSIGYHKHDKIEEIYYIISGKGRLTSNDRTFDVKKGDCMPVFLHGKHGIYNNGTDDLCVLVFGATMEKGVFQGEDLGDDLSTR